MIDTILNGREAASERSFHVSGHLSQEDHYKMLGTLQPQHVIPAHQDIQGFFGYVNLAAKQRYKLGRDLHVPRMGASSSWCSCESPLSK